MRNTRDHYVATQLELATAKGVRPLNHASKINILMDPLEVIEIPYFFNVDGIHKSGYSYDYTFSLSSTWSSNEAHVKINVKDGAPMFYAKM